MRIRRWIDRLSGRHSRRIFKLRHGMALWLTGKLAARICFTAFLVFGTYNPTGRSWYHFVTSGSVPGIWKIIATFLLAVAYGVIVPLTWRALGLGGTILTTILATTWTWVVVESGWINVAAPDTPVWITLSIISFVLGVGSCWILIGRLLDGQARTRDITR